MITEVETEAGKKKCFLRPVGNRVIVAEDAFHYGGRVYIPDTAKRRPTTGHIVAVGGDIDTAWLGKRVVYGQFSGTLLAFKGKSPFRVLSFEEILSEITLEDVELDETDA